MTSIGSNAFNGCSNLKNIKVPVTDFSAFCSNQIVSLIRSNIGKPVLLIDGNGNEIKEYEIPDNVTSISSYAFYNCTGLTSVTIPNSVRRIGGYAFYNCTGLDSINIPDSVTSIGNGAFCKCSGLTSVTIPNSVRSIGDDLFYYCI